MNKYEKCTEFHTFDGCGWKWGVNLLQLPMVKTGRFFDKEIGFDEDKENLRLDEFTISFETYPGKTKVESYAFLIAKQGTATYVLFDDEADIRITRLINQRKRVRY